MRILVTGDVCMEEVIAEPFEIEGSREAFAVHRAIDGDFDRGFWTATHVDTGLALGRGETIDGAIDAARTAWNAASPELRQQAIERGCAARAERANWPTMVRQ